MIRFIDRVLPRIGFPLLLVAAAASSGCAGMGGAPDSYEPTLPELASAPPSGNGAIYQAGYDVPLFENSTARRVGDILTVRLHPSDARALRDACAARSDTTGIAGVVTLAERVIEDAHLSAGGVVVDTPRGEYQATLDTLLTKLLKLVDQQRVQHSGQDQVPHVRLA